MTRHGSLAYYLAAWVCGCTFMGILLWMPSLFGFFRGGAAGLFFIVVGFAMMCGAVTSLLFGFVLRRVAEGMQFRTTWHWIVAGAALAPLLITALGFISSLRAFPRNGEQVWHPFFFFVLGGPSLIHYGRPSALALTAPAGAATAWVLFRVQRAFALHHPLGQTENGNNLAL